MFISQAYAQASAGGGSSFLIQIAPLILIFAVFYFLIIRPRQKKMKEDKVAVKIRKAEEDKVAVKIGKVEEDPTQKK